MKRATLFVGLALFGLAATGLRAQLAHEVTEKAFDGKHAVTEKTRKVDANSDIVITFNVATNAPAEEVSVRWKIVSNFLANVQVDMARRSELMQRFKAFKVGNPEEEKRFNQEINEFNRTSFERLQEGADRLGLNDAEWKRIISGRFDGLGTAAQGYINLARWLSLELENLNRQAASFTASRTVQVTVQAFHDARGQARKA